MIYISTITLSPIYLKVYILNRMKVYRIDIMKVYRIDRMKVYRIDRMNKIAKMNYYLYITR